MSNLFTDEEKDYLQYALQLSSSPANPTFDMVFNSVFERRHGYWPISNRKYTPTSYSSLGYDENNHFVWSETREEIRCLSIGISEPFSHHTKHDDYQFIYTDGSKEGDRIGCTCGTHWVMERQPNVASIYAAELRALYLALSNAIGSPGLFVLPRGLIKFSHWKSSCHQYFRTTFHF